MKILDEQGYLIVSTGSNQYTTCAINLAKSIKQHNKIAKVCLLTDTHIDNEYIDYCKPFPYKLNLDNPFANDWQVFYASPFRETIKLESDMLVTSNIDYFWDLMCKRDVVCSTGARDFYNNSATSRHYRKLFDQNDLPDVYNALVYWRISNSAKEFFDLTRTIFENWNEFKKIIKFSEEVPSTDFVYAIAAKIIGQHNVTLPHQYSPNIVHMKKHINPLQTLNWTNELVWEKIDKHLKVNTVYQTGLFHYYIKDWITEFEQQ